MTKLQQRYECPVCGKVTSGRKPRQGDGTAVFPRKHKVKGGYCPGTVEYAIWLK